LIRTNGKLDDQTFREYPVSLASFTNVGGEKTDIREIEIAEEITSGKVVGVGEAVEIETKFGSTFRVPIRVKINETEVEVSVFVRAGAVERKQHHPRSNVYKLLTSYNCRSLNDLVGKTVSLRIDSRGFYRIV